jgi:hypothetical protein
LFSSQSRPEQLWGPPNLLSNGQEGLLKYMKCTRKKEKLDNIIKIGEHEIERVKEFKYLGIQVNVHNIMKEEINSRIKQGNIIFYANKNLLGNKLQTRKAKIKLYKLVILPVVTYGYETWTMK